MNRRKLIPKMFDLLASKRTNIQRDFSSRNSFNCVSKWVLKYNSCLSWSKQFHSANIVICVIFNWVYYSQRHKFNSILMFVNVTATQLKLSSDDDNNNSLRWLLLSHYQCHYYLCLLSFILNYVCIRNDRIPMICEVYWMSAFKMWLDR